MLLLVVTVTALLWANSPASDAYFDLWHQGAGFELGPVALHMSLHHWINDGLTVVFFFLIGLGYAKSSPTGHYVIEPALVSP
ncbi:hypothetical protein GCM10020255_015950 [Rhodococcus baikonurensis]